MKQYHLHFVETILHIKAEKNSCVSANPTDPDFLCRPCSFYCHFERKEKDFHPYRPLKFSDKWTYDLKYVKTATIIFKITLFNLLYVLNFNVCHYLVFEMNQVGYYQFYLFSTNKN